MIVVLAHGSPDPRHRAGVAMLTRQVARLLAPEAVSTAYLQHHGPNMTEAVSGARDGALGSVTSAESVWVLPLLLSDGVHVTQDVPDVVGAAEVARPDLDWRVLPTLPPATLALAVVELLRSSPSAPHQPRGVVAVAAGSSRPGALAAFEGVASALRPAGVELVVANGPGPAIGQAAELLTALGARDHVVVPFMFADGFLAERAADTARGLGLHATRPIGESVEAAEALAAWATAHVRHDTPRRAWPVIDLVDAAP